MGGVERHTQLRKAERCFHIDGSQSFVWDMRRLFWGGIMDNLGRWWGDGWKVVKVERRDGRQLLAFRGWRKGFGGDVGEGHEAGELSVGVEGTWGGGGKGTGRVERGGKVVKSGGRERCGRVGEGGWCPWRRAARARCLGSADVRWSGRVSAS